MKRRGVRLWLEGSMAMELRRDMYQITGASAQGLVLAAALALSAAVFLYLTLSLEPGDPLRRDLLAAAWGIYCLRVLAAEAYRRR